ncbi:MAG: type II secretion system F family protein [Halobacteriaceae archaeon]
MIGLLVGAIIAGGLDQAGVLAALSSPVDVSGGIVSFLAANKVWLAGGLLTIVTAAVFGGVTWSFRYYYPRQRVDRRRRNINFVLPHAIVFMYALSHSGMDLLQVLKKLAVAEDAYGAVAEEFDMVVRDVELFGNDLYTALRNARNLTPSDNLEQFLDDMVSVLESGGNVTQFFEDQSERYMNRARDEQEDFLETLSLLSEVFIVAFVAAPLFLIVILMVIAILGGTSLGVLGALIYGIIVLGMAAFLVLVSVISDPYTHPEASLEEAPTRNGDLDDSDLADSEDYHAYRRAKRWARVRAFIAAPLAMTSSPPNPT